MWHSSGRPSSSRSLYTARPPQAGLLHHTRGTPMCHKVWHIIYLFAINTIFFLQVFSICFTTIPSPYKNKHILLPDYLVQRTNMVTKKIIDILNTTI